jgi:hypothetical protein
MVVLVATSEGVTRTEIRRHRWANLLPMWNMSREGFRELYEKAPNPKPPFEDVWRWTGGNPRVLSRLYEFNWDIDTLVKRTNKGQEPRPQLINQWKEQLTKAVDDPDSLWRDNTKLLKILTKKKPNNPQHVQQRTRPLDRPATTRKRPRTRNRENVAWQTPAHREAVRRAL